MLSWSSYCICLLSTFPLWHQSSGRLAAPACFWQNGVAWKWRPFCLYMAAYIYKRLKTALWKLQQLDYTLQPLILHWHQNILFSYSPAGEKCQVTMPADRRRSLCLQAPGFNSMRTTAPTLLLLVLESAYTPEYPCSLVHSSVPGRDWEKGCT